MRPLALAIISFLFSSVLLSSPHESYADQGHQAQLAKAQSLIEKGNELFKQKQYQEGIKAYQKAQQMIPDVKNLFVIATAFGYLPDRCQDTLSAWGDFFKSCDQSCRYLQSGLMKHKEQLARCTVTVNISSATPGLTVTHKGVVWGTGPKIEKKLTASEYKEVTFSAPGFHSYTRDLSVKPKQPLLKLEVALVPDLKPSFLDKNSAFIGAATGVLALTSVLYAANQVGRYNDALTQARALQGEASMLDSSNESAYLSLKTQFQSRQVESDTAVKQFWLGVGGAVVFASVSAWVWFKEPDVKIDTSLKPSMEELSSLRWSITPWGGSLSVQF